MDPTCLDTATGSLTDTETRRGQVLRPRESTLSSDRFLAAIVDSSDDAIIGKTLDGIITSWNLGAARLYGYVAAEAIDQHISLIIPVERADELTSIMVRLRQGRRIDHFETVRVSKDGTRRDISLSISPIHDDSGLIIGAASIGRDITERRRGEADLRAAEARYRALVEHLPVVVALNAPDETQSTLYISPTCEAIFGYTPDEYLADPTLWVQTMHPDDRERVLAGVARMNATGESGLVEYRMLARDGHVVCILEDSTLIHDNDGRPLYWQTVQMDVTARKQAEDALQQSEERFRTAFDSAAIGMALIALDGTIQQVNAALCALTGYSEAELLARTVQDITHPDDFATDLEQMQRVVAGEIGAYQMEKRYIHKSGQVVSGHLSGAVVRDAFGSPLNFIGQLENITARKQAEKALQQSEERFRTAFDDAAIGMGLVDLNGSFFRVNAAFCELTGYTASELLTRTFHDITHPDDLEPELAQLAHLLSGEIRAYDMEKRYLGKDGTVIWICLNTSLVRDEHGAPLHFIGQVEDITARKRAEEDLREALEAAQEANRAKGNFVDMMSHELRTPLQAVLGYSEFLLIAPEDSLTDEQREDIGAIHRASGRMITLINQLLDLSRMDARRLELAVERVDLHQVIEAVRQDVAPQAAAKELVLEIDLPPTLPVVLGDAERVRQIVLNLAGNAVKFTTKGSVRITATPLKSGGVEVAVSDTGIGIPAEALPRIFEAFRQVGNGLTRQQGGSGLGLTIAGKLAEQMGGAITVNSEPGVGSTFRLCLPGEA